MSLDARYALGETLSERGPVRTRLATDRETGAPVVVKTLSVRRAASAREIDLFTRECAVLEHLSHPQIPRFITHAVEDDGRDGDVHLHLVMERIAGRSLSALIDGGRSFSEREVRDIARGAARVLAYLHEKSPPVVHRDLKPSNILLTDDGRVVLIDFGAVKRAAAGDTTIVGTFGYMPPEQYEGRARPSSDIYALGMTLIALLTHKEPADFGDGGAREEWRALANASEALKDLVDDMIAIDPARRPRDGAALSARLDALDRPPPKSAPRAPAQKRSLFAVVAAVAGLVAVVMVAGIGGVVFWVAQSVPTVVVPELKDVVLPPPVIPPPVTPTPPTKKLDTLGLGLTRFVWRCRDRAIPRILQSEARYRSWLPERAGPPTCKERYISYGLYSAYEDAIAECARVAEALPMTDAHDLARAFARLAPAVATTIPLLDEADRYYDREVYLDDGCAGAQALHARLVPAFAEVRAASALVEDALLATMKVELSATPPVDEPIVHATRATIARAIELAELAPTFDDGKQIDVAALTARYRALMDAASTLEAEAQKLPPERAGQKSHIVALVDDVHAFKGTIRQLGEAKQRGRDVRHTFALSSHDPWRVRGLADLVVRRAVNAFE